MKLTDLHPTPGSHKKEKRFGRGHGTGRGKTAGRGTKGQKARTGGKVHRAFNGGQTRLSKRLPFLRGLGNSNIPFRHDYAIIKLEDLSRLETDTQITPESLIELGFLTNTEGSGRVKVLGEGEIDHAVNVRAHKFTKSAREKIEAAGGTVEIIPVKVYAKTKRRKDEKQQEAGPQETDTQE
jgi:large subunit ribosomal protein L15